MVQFELKLNENIIEKWRARYLDYRLLKKILSAKAKAAMRSGGRKAIPRVSSYDRSGEKTALLGQGRARGAGTPPPTSEFSRSVSMNAEPGVSGSFASYCESLHERYGPDATPTTEFEEALLKEIMKFCSFYSRKVEAFHGELERYQTEMKTSSSFEDDSPVLRSHELQNIEEGLAALPEVDLGPTAFSDVQPPHDSGSRTSRPQPKSSHHGLAPDLSRQETKMMSPLGASDMNHDRKSLRGQSSSQKRALHTLYKEIVLLQTFAIINYTAVIKITKKASKVAKEVLAAAVATAASAGTVGAPELAQPQPPCRTKLFNVTQTWMESYAFDEGTAVNDLARRVEQLYASLFTDGNVRVAFGELQTQAAAEEGPVSFELLKLGYRLGMGATLGLWMLWDCIIQGLKSGQPSLDTMAAFPAFCALAGLLLVHWSWGIQVWVWTRSRINYIFLFELDPRHTRSYIQILNDCTTDSIWYLFLTLLYFKAELKHLPFDLEAIGFYPGHFLIIGIIYAGVRLVHPWRQRKDLWSCLLTIMWPISSSSVTFFQTYVSDVLTSLVKVFVDLAFTIGFISSGQVWTPGQHWHSGKRCSNDVVPGDDDDYSDDGAGVGGSITGLALQASSGSKAYGHSHWQQSFVFKDLAIPLVLFLPLWLRFLQCLVRYGQTQQRWPHLGNATKYFLAMLVTLFGALHPLYTTFSSTWQFQAFWLSLFIISTLLSTWWDIHVDWGLFRKGLSGGLNDRQMYSKRWYYYTAMVVDFFLRFVWVYSLVPPTTGALTFWETMINWLTPIAMFLEVVRRTIWGFFRLENEHLRNTEGFRRVDVVPLHFDRVREQLNAPVGNKVVFEVVSIGCFVVVVGAAVLIASQQNERNSGHSHHHSS